MTIVKRPTFLRDYWTGKEITGPVAERKLSNIDRIMAEQDQATMTPEQRNSLWWRVNTISGVLKPIRA